MTTSIKNLAVIEDKLSPDDAFAVQIDISAWLGTDTISSVTYSAVDGDGDNAVANVIDRNKCVNTQTVIKPYILGHTTGGKFTVKCLVTTTGGDYKAWYVQFECREFAG